MESLMKFCGRYGDDIKHYEVSILWMLNNILKRDQVQWSPN